MPHDPLRIAILAAGAAGMYCGSCLRDNLLASALLRAGQKVTLVPMYTPLKTDEPGISGKQVFYGGVNLWLQYASGLFRHTPRAVDWLFDRPWLLQMAGQYGAQTSPAKLGPFIISMMKGDTGPQVKELRRLVRFLKGDSAPQVVSLPNTMFIGLARMLRDELKAPVVCELTGEDIFLDAMAEPYRSEALSIMRERASDVSRFVATSHYYADRMASYLQIERERISVVYPGIPLSHMSEKPAVRAEKSPPTVGYLARICPEKGIDRLVDAMPALRERIPNAAIHAAGYLGPANRDWFEPLRKELSYLGEVDLPGKLAFLDSLDVLSVPTAYEEPKGMYVIEALGRGIPVVQPRHGAFPELIEMTGGGVLVEPGNPRALADGLAQVLLDPSRRDQLARAGHSAVRERFTDDQMAANMLQVYQQTL
jgi:glycosyltransferase involved in cell wall biosynthesis